MHTIKLDFERAKSLHIAFKTALRAYLYSAAEASLLTTPQECGLGEWLYGHALTTYASIPEIQALEQAHHQIYRSATELVQLYQQGQVTAARAGLANLEQTDNLVNLLSIAALTLQQQASANDEAPAQLLTHYRELLDLHQKIQALDERIQQQTKEAVLLKQEASLNEHRFLNVVKQVPAGIAIFRGEAMIVEMANDAYLEIINKTAGQLIGRSLFDSLPEVKEAVEPLLLNVMRTGNAHYGNEFQVNLHRFGQTKKAYFNFVYQPLREADGAITGVIVVANEVTRQVEAKHALEQREAHFRNLVTQSPIAMTIFKGPDFVIDVANNTLLQKLWRRTLEEVQGKKLLDVFPELEGQPYPELLKLVYESGKVYQQSEAVVYIDGPGGVKRHYLDFEYAPLFDTDGSVLGIMVTISDLTERKEIEIALRASEERFRLLASTMPQFVWTADNTGQLNYFSQTVMDYSGKPLAALLGKGWLDIIHPEDRAENIALWNEAIATGKDFLFEHRFRKHNGEYRWQLSRAIPQKDPIGDITLWVGTSTDIHDHRLFTDQLETEVLQRTQELKKMNEALLSSNNELAQFAYVASHDLQEPLRKIKTFVSRLLDTEKDRLSDNGQHYFERIHVSAARMQQLIVDLLAFSSVNMANTKHEQVDLNDLLQTVLDNLSEPIQDSHVVINSDPLPSLQLIRFQFEQLFTNILSNALKFARKGIQPQIGIRCRLTQGADLREPTLDADKPYYHFSIADNGIGFEPEFSERIFLVFQRLHIRNAYEGTGIGLAICKKIVENHQGTIRAEGKPGEGAVFHIYLPA